MIDNNIVFENVWRILSLPVFYPFYALVFVTLAVRAFFGRRRRR